MKMRIKGLALAIGFAAIASTSVNASIQQQVNSMFNSMINVTAPGAFQTATSGVISGGNVMIRNRISTVNLAYYTPPSAKGGCGGINMYAGSFSFINAEEFIGLMRNIASNAAGVASAYAFQIALEAMDSMTSGVITDLSDKMQALNQAMLNSCQLANGIVTETKAAFEEGRDLRSAVRGVISNVSSDFFGSKRATGESPAQRIFEAGEAQPCKDVGNILWCAMDKTRFVSQFSNGSTENAEFLMSLVGSYLVSYGPDSDGGNNFVATPVRPLEGVNLQVFVEGTAQPLTIYDCDSDCLDPSTRQLPNIEGLANKIVKATSEAQVFERLYNGDAFSAAEMNAYGWLFSTGIGTYAYQINQLAGPDAAYSFLARHANPIALDAALDTIKTMLEIALGGVRELEMADSSKVEDDLNKKLMEIRAEALNLMTNRYSIIDPLQELNEYKSFAAQQDSGRLSQGATIQSAQ